MKHRHVPLNIHFTELIDADNCRRYFVSTKLFVHYQAGEAPPCPPVYVLFYYKINERHSLSVFTLFYLDLT